MKITKKHRRLLLSMCIGDGSVGKNGKIEIWHSINQEDYVRYKASLIKPLLTHDGLLYRDSGNFKQVGFRVKISDYTKLLRRILYTNGKKTISQKILNKLEPIHLAIWWMDDGSCSMEYCKPNNNIRSSISTLSTCISKEENQVIIDWFKSKYDIQFGQRKMKNNYALVCRLKEGRKLANIVRDFIIPSMEYKISK